MSTREEIDAAATRLSFGSKVSRDCEHLYSAHRQCQWCHCMRNDIDATLLADAYLAERQQRERDQQPPTREMFERLGATLDRFHVLTLKAIEWHAECHCPWWDAIQLDTIAKLRAACLLLGIETEWML